MKRLLVYGVCLLAFITVGCGEQPIAGTSPTYAYEVRWNNQHYSVTVSPVKVVGKLLGTIQHFEINPTTPENNWSNFFPVGAKLYSVPGNSPNNKIAGEFNGKYIECDAFNPPS